VKLNILDGGQNKIEVEFNDISSEQYREYNFSNGSKLRIEKPEWLYVSNGGGHRLVDNSGQSWYIARATDTQIGWISIMWKVKYGEPFFVR
jgi:hypothetical protein